MIPVEALEIYIRACQENLKSDTTAQQYLAERGFTSATVDSWRLGSMPHGGRDLARLHKALAPYAEETYPLLRWRDGFFESDFLNNRMIVPIHDQYGELVAISGRVMPETDYKTLGIPKYYNTTYPKASHLFGLHMALPTVMRSGEIIICEGGLDVIAAHQGGVKNVVASGSATVSPAQLTLAARYADRVWIAMDNDEAGRQAQERLKQRLPQFADELGIDLHFLDLVGGKDIDDIMKARAALAWA